MNKLLIAFGLIILFVTVPCASQEFDPEVGYIITAEGASDEDIYDDDSVKTKGKFVESDGIKKTCTSQSDCYNQREPPSWRDLNENQSWTDKGCYCDRKENACIIERKNRGKLEYTYCASEHKVDDVNEYDDDFQQIITDKDDSGDKASDKDINDDESYTTKGKFVESDGIKKTCTSQSDCYNQREPSSSRDLNENQTWIGKGSYCNRKENGCIVERKNRGRIEYISCALEECCRCA